MALIDNLQSWAKCSECGEVLWCETSTDEQRCGCICGGLRLHDGVTYGTIDETFTSEDMETILEAESL
jgi:hypothetical protein